MADSPTAERVDIERYEDDLPEDTLPGFRPARFPEVAAGERKLFLALRRVWRRFARDLWAVLRLPGRSVAQASAEAAFTAWGPEEQAAFARLIAQFEEALMGSASTPDQFVAPAISYTPIPPTNSLHEGPPLLPEHIRAMYRVGVNRAMSVLGTQTSAIGGVRNEEAIQAMMRIAFGRLSDGARLKLTAVLDGEVPGGSVKALLNMALEQGTNPLVVARELRAKFADIEGYNWARLARTETAFAQVSAMRTEYEASGYTLTGGVLVPPFHPSCVCGLTVSVAEKRIRLDVALTACEVCQARKLEEQLLITAARNEGVWG